MSSARLYDRNYNYALLSQVGFAMVNTAMLAHYPRWIAHLGGEVDATGWITGTASLTGLILRPWIGQWIDRFGAKVIWLAGYAIFSIGSISNLWLLDLGPPIYVCRALLVIGGAIVFSSALTYVTHLAPLDRRAEAIGTLGAAAFLGIVFGPFLGELILTADRTREEFEAFCSFDASHLSMLFSVCTVMPRTARKEREVLGPWRRDGLAGVLQTSQSVSKNVLPVEELPGIVRHQHSATPASALTLAQRHEAQEAMSTYSQIRSK